MFRQLLKLSICLALFAVSNFSCSTVEKIDENPKSYYTLRLGEVFDHGSPLPKETKILIDWHSDSGAIKTVDGFVGYDFDRDGKFEMIKVLDENGEPKSYVYDFDGNGNIDSIAGRIENDIDLKTVFAQTQKLLIDTAISH